MKTKIITHGMDFYLTDKTIYNEFNNDMYNMYVSNDMSIVFKRGTTAKGDLTDEQVSKVKDALLEVKTNAPYSHWKTGDLYYVHSVGVNETDNTIVIVYQSLYDEFKYYLRTYSSFFKEIPEDRKEENLTNQSKRFELLDVTKGGF